MIKDQIILKQDKKQEKLNEKALHKYIIEMLENKFLELGVGFALLGHEYKISIDNHTFKIDLLFFNVKLNAYVVVEVKLNKGRREDIEQVRFYSEIVDKQIKEKSNNKTIGILIVKEKDKFIIKYATDKEIYLTNYVLN